MGCNSFGVIFMKRDVDTVVELCFFCSRGSLLFRGGLTRIANPWEVGFVKGGTFSPAIDGDGCNDLLRWN